MKIKFRVAHPKGWFIAYEELGEKGWQNTLLNNNETTPGIFDEHFFKWPSILQRQQFTGLMIENEELTLEEVYEGDIIQIEFEHYNKWLKKVGIVRYETDHGGFIIEWEYSKNQHYKELTCDILIDAIRLGNNIENPELIEKYNL